MSPALDKNLKISFCTTCMGRGHHLVETLPQNLANNADYPNTEFVILDYGDRKGIPPLKENEETGELEADIDAPEEEWRPIKQWLMEEFADEIASGRIKYARTEQEHFRMAHAKNMAHRLGTGEVLVNLDADNVTGKGFAGWLNKKFSENMNSIVRPDVFVNNIRGISGASAKGTAGRIGISKEVFQKLHGYNEQLHNGYTGDDTDLINRSKILKLKTVRVYPTHLGSAIGHDNSERLDGLSEQDQKNSQLHFDKTRKSILGNIQYKSKRLAEHVGVKKREIRYENPEGQFGCGEVTVLKPDFSEEKQTLNPTPHPEWVASYGKSSGQSQTGWSMG